MEIDTSRTDQKYWERILKDENLDMSRGRRRTDEYAEKMYCADMATRLQEAGQELPTTVEVEGCEIVVDSYEDTDE